MAGIWSGAEAAVRRAAEDQSRQRLADAEMRRAAQARLGATEERTRLEAMQEAGRLLAAAQARKEAETLLQAKAHANADQASDWAAARADLARMQVDARARLSPQALDGTPSEMLRQQSPARNSQINGQPPSPPLEQYTTAPQPPPRRQPAGQGSVEGDSGNSFSRFAQIGANGAAERGVVPLLLDPRRVALDSSPALERLKRSEEANGRRLLEKTRMEALEAAKRKAEEAAQKVAELQAMRRQLPRTPDAALRQRQPHSGSGTRAATDGAAISSSSVETAALRAIAMMDGPILSASKERQALYSGSTKRESSEVLGSGRFRHLDGMQTFQSQLFGPDSGDAERNQVLKSDPGPKVLWTSGQASQGPDYSPKLQDGGDRQNISPSARTGSASSKSRREDRDLFAAIDQGRRPPAAMHSENLDQMDIVEAQESNAARNATSWQRKARLFGLSTSPSHQSGVQV